MTNPVSLVTRVINQSAWYWSSTKYPALSVEAGDGSYVASTCLSIDDEVSEGMTLVCTSEALCRSFDANVLVTRYCMHR